MTVVSGGDDNGIFLARFSLAENFHLEKVQILKFPNAHGSSVKGIKFVAFNLFGTVSSDQRLNFWEWTPGTTSLRLQKSYIAEVSDISSLDIHQESPNKLMISVVGNEQLVLETQAA